MTSLTQAQKNILLVCAVVIGGAFVLITSSNLTLLITDKHDGTFHVLTIFQLLQSSDQTTNSAAFLSVLASLMGVFFCVALIVKAPKPSLYGKARFATEAEIAERGLLAKEGILLGKFNKRYLVFEGSEHVLVYAPTRGGKGVGVVIPNLLNWAGSSLVVDIKKENWEKTAGFREKHGQEVFLFDPLDKKGCTARYNPFFYVNRFDVTDLYDDLQKIAVMLLPIENASDSFWTHSARSGFLAIAGYVAETHDLPFTLGEVYRQLSASVDLKTHFLQIIKQREQTERPLSQICKTALNDFLGTSENTFSSIRKTISARLELWSNARIDKATSGNDFDLRALRRKPISIYLGVTPDNLSRLAPLITLFLQQAVDLNTRTLPEQDKSLKWQVMFMLDEFPALGNVEIIEKGAAYMAGYGLRLVTIIQSPAQLYALYGEHKAKNYITNHGVEIVFTPKEYAVSKELSDRFGVDTITARSVSKGVGFSARGGKSQSLSDHGRPLMLPQELVLTPFETAYILKGGMHPIKAEKILYFQEKDFLARLFPPPEVPPIPTEDKQTTSLVRDARESDYLSVLSGNCTVLMEGKPLECSQAYLEGTPEDNAREMEKLISDLIA